MTLLGWKEFSIVREKKISIAKKIRIAGEHHDDGKKKLFYDGEPLHFTLISTCP